MIAAVIIGGAWTQTATAGDCGCASSCGNGCDGCGGCGLTCKLECTTKKITKTCYGVKCDAKCLPCPSRPGCKHCERACTDGCDDCCKSCDKKPNCVIRWREWCPTTAKLRHVRKLEKYEYTIEVPSYKWVVVKCGAACDCGASEGGSADPAPTPAAKSAQIRYKTVPAGARLGDVLQVSAEELKQIQQWMAPLPRAASTGRATAAK
jgi:hypothetical protein